MIPGHHLNKLAFALAGATALIAAPVASAAFTLVINNSTETISIASEDYGINFYGSSRSGSGFVMEDTMSAPISNMNLSFLMVINQVSPGHLMTMDLQLGYGLPDSATARFAAVSTDPEIPDWDFIAQARPGAFFDYSSYSLADKAALEGYAINGDTIQTLTAGVFPSNTFEFVLVPEPTTTGLVLIGLAGGMFFGRRR